MRCSPRLPTYVVSLILLIFLIAWGKSLDGERAKDIAVRELKKLYGDRVRIVEIRTLLRKPVTYKEVEKIILKVREGNPRGSAYIYLRTPKGERIITVSMTLRWRCEAYVLTEDVKKGDRIYPWMVSLESSYRERCPSQNIDDPSELINYVALKDLRRGDIVRKSKLKPEPLVRRGDEVNIVYRSGNLEISFVGEALENGYYGERIRVRSKNTGKVLRGKVMAEGTVVIE